MVTASTDADLLHRYACDADNRAFSELVERYIRLVYHAARRETSGDSHAAEDVTQSVFTRMAERAASLVAHGSLAGWLHQTTRFVASEARRAEHRRRTREHEAYVMNNVNELGAPPANWEQVRPLIDAAVSELNDADREAVLLRFFANLPFAQVGTRLAISENTARMRVERALDKLHRQLLRRGISSSAAALGTTLIAEAGADVPSGLAAAVSGKAVAAAAAASAMSATPLIGFMSAVKFTVGLAAVLGLILAVATGTHTWRARQTDEAALETAQRSVRAQLERSTELERRAAALEKEVAPLRQSLAEFRAARAAAESKTAAAAAAPAKPAEEIDRRKEGDLFMARHPDVKAALGDYMRARVNFRFGEMYRELGLNAEQIARFQALVAQGGMGSEGPDGREMTLAWSQEKSADFTREMTELLGPAGWKMYRDLNRVDESRNLAVHIAGGLASSDTPLTPAQADQLVATLAGNRVKSGVRTANSRVDWDVVLVKARGFLLPSQLVMLEAEQAQELHERVLFDR